MSDREDFTSIVRELTAMSEADLAKRLVAIRAAMRSEPHELGTRFLVVEIPPKASDEDAEKLIDVVAEAAYGLEREHWDPFVYGWRVPADQAAVVKRPERVRTYDAATGEPHDDVLRTKTGRILTDADIQRFAEEDETLETVDDDQQDE